MRTGKEMEQVSLFAAMGYRHLGKGVWGKPWGPSLISIDTTKQDIRQIFYDRQGEVRVWNSRELDFTQPVEELQRLIMTFETYETHAFECWNNKHFCFLTPEERAAALLEG